MPTRLMELCRSLALLTGCLGLATILVAVSTDFWFVAVGPKFTAHSGLWPTELGSPVTGYIHVTQAFCILAALWSLVSVVFLVLSYIPSLSAPGRGPIVSCISAFAAVLSTIVAMAVYTSERWSQPQHTQIQCFFSWSFYLGWVTVPLLLCAGGLSLGAHYVRPPGYESL